MKLSRAVWIHRHLLLNSSLWQVGWALHGAAPNPPQFQYVGL